VARTSHAAAARALAERDPAMARLVELAGLPKLRERHGTNFEALVRSIVFQQLAGAAASTIHGRFVALLDGRVEPATVLVQSDEALRSVGLSGNKAASIRDLATKVADGTVILDPRRLARETDEDLITRLSSVRGIGRWTAEMFLIFQLRRLDVWPTGDLGVRRGYGLAHGIAMPTPKELEQYGDPYRPYRSVAAWYCWRATEVYAGAKESAVTS
jgi:DNA-3-methyladenine glycosylase II